MAQKDQLICPVCDNTVTPDDESCPNCGTWLRDDNPQEIEKIDGQLDAGWTPGEDLSENESIPDSSVPVETETKDNDETDPNEQVCSSCGESVPPEEEGCPHCDPLIEQDQEHSDKVDHSEIKIVDAKVSRRRLLRNWFCPKCDRRIRRKWQYCPYCAHSLPSRSSRLLKLIAKAWKLISPFLKKYRSQIYKSLALILLVIFLLFLPFGWVYRHDLVQRVIGTYTPTPSLIPTMTITPRPPTATPTIAPTITPTPIPDSQFLLLDDTILLPKAPTRFEKAWLLNNEDAILQPRFGGENSPWQIGVDTLSDGEHEKYYYTDVSDVYVKWELDRPVKEPGLYQIFFLDTRRYSETSVLFEVLSNGEVLEPIIGAKQVYLDIAEYQEEPRWVSLGFYRFNVGIQLAVQADIELHGTKSFAIDRLLILKVSEDVVWIEDEDFNLYRWPDWFTYILADDTDAEFASYRGDTLAGYTSSVNIKTWLGVEHVSDLGSWNRGYRTISADHRDGKGNILVIWQPQRVPAGLYQVWVRIPKHASVVEGVYGLIVNDEFTNIYLDDQRNASQLRRWIPIGLATILEESTVSVYLAVDQELPGDIVVDAVALQEGSGFLR